jgi:hypothetical protein
MANTILFMYRDSIPDCFITKQPLSLFLTKFFSTMTKQELQEMIATHRAQMERAKRILDEYYYELEARGEETRWLNDYIRHRKFVAELELEIPDDE